VACFIVGGEHKCVLVRQINIEAVGTPWFIIDCRADGEDVVPGEEEDYAGVGGQGSGFRVQGAGFKVQGARLRVKGLRC